MRWQAIQERGAEDVPITALGLLEAGQHSVEEVEGLGNITERLKTKVTSGESIANFFIESMKIK
jgi:hypothetical protein